MSRARLSAAVRVSRPLGSGRLDCLAPAPPGLEVLCDRARGVLAALEALDAVGELARAVVEDRGGAHVRGAPDRAADRLDEAARRRHIDRVLPATPELPLEEVDERLRPRRRLGVG